MLRQTRPLEPRTVLVIDAASMLGTRACAELLDRVDAAHGKLVIAGDTSQLAAIEAGGMLSALASRLEAIELHDNRRQEQAWKREAVRLLRDSAGEAALALYERHNRLHIGSDARDVLSRLSPRSCSSRSSSRTDSSGSRSSSGCHARHTIAGGSKNAIPPR